MLEFNATHQSAALLEPLTLKARFDFKPTDLLPNQGFIGFRFELLFSDFSPFIERIIEI